MFTMEYPRTTKRTALGSNKKHVMHRKEYKAIEGDLWFKFKKLLATNNFLFIDLAIELWKDLPGTSKTNVIKDIKTALPDALSQCLNNISRNKNSRKRL